MEDKQIIIATTESQLETVLYRILKKFSEKPEPDFTEDRLTRMQAAKFAGISLPTLRKRAQEGIFKIYGKGRKGFLLKSEIIEALKKEAG